MGNKKIVNIDILESNLTQIADNIRALRGTSELLNFPEDFIDALDLNEIVQQSELDSYLAKFTNRTIDIIDNDKIKGTTLESFQHQNTNLTYVNLPQVTALAGSSFGGCTNLTYVNLPKVTTINGGVLSNSKLTSLYLPSLTTITGWSWNFNHSGRLKRVYFPKLTGTITNRDFINCNVLDTLILGYTGGVCSLSDIEAFNNTPIASGTGYIYVPKALVESYKTAENWSTYASQIRAIEDYPEILEGWE